MTLVFLKKSSMMKYTKKYNPVHIWEIYPDLSRTGWSKEESYGHCDQPAVRY